MTRLVHLTDLHFGLHRPELVAPLREAVLSAAPDVVAVSGDLTQRALPGQFAQAIAFLRDLARPCLMVPGNHDLPAFNPLLRLFDPFRPFRKGAATDLTPALQVGRLRLFGLNTADPLRWRGGLARPAEIDRIRNALRDTPAGCTNIAVCHHPLEEPPGFQRGETGGGDVALERLAGAGVHVTLSGHLHHWTTGLGIAEEGARAVFQMQSGTALCGRPRERDHGFALMTFGADRLAVTLHILDEPSLTFLPRASRTYACRAGQWRIARQA